MFKDFTGPPIVLSLRVPKSWSLEAAHKQRMRNGFVASTIINELPNITRFECGVRGGELYFEATVIPDAVNTAESLTESMKRISERLNGMSKATLQRDWEATPPEQRRTCKIVREPDVQAT